MPDLTGKQIWSLKIDNEFKGLIRPLFRNEYRQLEENLLSDGCREPISVWNGVIVDGHNRYKICLEHGIPFAVEELSFSCREEAVAWICANQLGRRNLTEESRKYLIGKQYESEKIVSRKKALNQTGNENPDSAELSPPSEHIQLTQPKRRTGARIAEENHISHGTVEKYSVYTRAIEEIKRKEPRIAAKILSGKYKISHAGVMTLAQRSEKELKELNERLERSESPFAKYQETRGEIQKLNPPIKIDFSGKTTVKDMPEFDPDAEIVGLTLTVPSWSSSISRMIRSDLSQVSENARANLCNALIELLSAINNMIAAIKEEKNESVH